MSTPGRLRKRRQFLALARGRKQATGSLVLQALARAGDNGAGEGPRFGFTVTRKVGGAVERNRVRRRLRAAVSQAAPLSARPDFDYVVIGRKATLTMGFDRILADLHRALRRVNADEAGKD